MYDVVVVGGGHAGIEACAALANRTVKTVLITMNKNRIGHMPCNPSIGGPAKGNVVREIDALGGLMGYVADETALQIKMLNTTKGPGVQSLREQSDRIAYGQRMQAELEKLPNLDIMEDMVIGLLTEHGKACGVRLASGTEISAKAVILTTGTYMAATSMVGAHVVSEGPDNDPTTNLLSEDLRAHGLQLFRLKTGTPPRVLTSSIDFTKCSEEPGSTEPYRFSDRSMNVLPYEKQVKCYLTYTSPKTHEIIQENLHRSSMYSGVVKGVGPRYCPSIEDKLVRFADKERHQIFLEPESLSLDTTYVQGFSTSMPHEIQEQMVRTLPGLENAIIKKYAYAIEYDAVDPLQLKPSLEVMAIENLYTAGQINGTSGYEEAAGQGLMAGINCGLKLEGKDPLILRRDEAYIGVMIDDLVTKGTHEPYRLLTSRAEYRLLLRHDNADARLLSYGYQLGLIDEKRYQAYQTKKQDIAAVMEQLSKIRFTPKHEINAYLQQVGYEPLSEGISAQELLRRPHVAIDQLLSYTDIQCDKAVARQVEIEVKYEGYINKALKDAEKLQKMEFMKIPDDLRFEDVEHLALEARQKFIKISPVNIGQASRISGVNPSDIAILVNHIETRKK